MAIEVIERQTINANNKIDDFNEYKKNKRINKTIVFIIILIILLLLFIALQMVMHMIILTIG